MFSFRFLSRSGVEPPTGKLHPREGRGQKAENRNQLIAAIAGSRRVFSFRFPLLTPRKVFAGVDRSGRGFNPRPAQTGSAGPAGEGGDLG